MDKDRASFNQINIIISEESQFQEKDLIRLWHCGIQADGEFHDIQESLVKDKGYFPPSVTAKI